MTPVRVALYARVSSEQQAEDRTIASQVAALEARIAQEGGRLPAEHRYLDEGYSGASLLRPALERLRDAMAAGEVDRLYVHSPDRLARRYAYQVLLMEEFRRAGVDVVFLNRPIGLSPEDDLLLQVQGMVAEYERAKMVERSRRGKRHSAHHGVVSVLAGAPYGYRYVAKAVAGGVARYEVIDAEAQVVRQVFQWIGRDRLSIGEVCRRLNTAGQLTRSGKATWDRSTVWAMLRNPAYVGQAAFGKTQAVPRAARVRPVRGGGETPRRPYRLQEVAPTDWIPVPVPALVGADLFEAAQAQLQENRRRNRQGQRGERYLLQGLVVCRHCGYAYYGKPVSLSAGKGRRREYAYYRCCGSDAYRFGGQRVCSNKQVRTDRLDEAVWRAVAGVLRDPGRLVAEYERRLQHAQGTTSESPELGSLDTQITKLRRGMDRLIDSYAEGLIEKADFEPRITGLKARLQALDEQRKTLADTMAVQNTLFLILGRLEDFSQKVRDNLVQADWHLQRELIRLLVKRVEIDQEAINVVFRIAPELPRPDGQNGPDRSVLQDCGWGGNPALGGSRGSGR